MMNAHTHTAERQRLSVAAYRSTVCCCLAAKKPGQSFCNACWHALPRELQHPLLGTYGTQYELAYFAAAEWLGSRLNQRKEIA